jgi:predicted AlkP superfamily phosphohydrolase/phosphomutase
VSSPPVRLLVLGLDGGDARLLERLAAEGHVPRLEALRRSSRRSALRSTLPPATLPAWTSFLCAAPPGEHGVIDQLVHPAGSYALRPASGSMRRLPTFLETLAARGLRVASLGVPGTHPPGRALGLCVAGFDSPGASHAGARAVWPPDARGELARLGGWRYAVVNEQRSGEARLEALSRALVADLEVKERVASWALGRGPWDVFFLHLQASDTAAHHLWHTYDEGSPRWRGPARRDLLPAVFRRLDALVGRVLDQTPGAAVLALSDHGMGGASDVAVHVNRALHRAGLLSFTGAPRRALRGGLGRLVRGATAALSPAALGLALELAPAALASRLLALARTQAVDFGASLAFSDELDYAPSVWLNRRGVFPAGCVDDGDAGRLLEAVREVLLGLRHPATGEPLVAAVHRREDALAGAACTLAPDLLVEPAWPGGYRPSFLPSPGPGPSVRSLEEHELSAARGAGMPGAHRRDGILLAAGPGLAPGDGPALELPAAGRLVYELLGLEPGTRQERSPELAARDAALLEQRLRELGYLE